jgi:HB1, ASXL, restriction endonuclease HTH domain
MSDILLAAALEGARPELEAGLAEAEAELRELERRKAELLVLVARARAALGVAAGGARAPAGPAPERPPTLHDALARVLREHGNEWMTARELTDEVNARGLYARRDGSPVEANEVHARTKSYAELFEKEGSLIRLRAG